MLAALARLLKSEEYCYLFYENAIPERADHHVSRNQASAVLFIVWGLSGWPTTLGHRAADILMA